MSIRPLNGGCNLRRALDLAHRLGCDVERRRGTGELFLRHHTHAKPLRVSGHRKDAARSVTTFLRRVMEAQGLLA